MKPNPHLLDNQPIPRRTVLTGLIGVVGTAVLGILPGKSFGQVLTRSAKPKLAFWNQSRFVTLEQLRGSGESLNNARITIRSFHGVGSIRAIDVLTRAQGPDGPMTVPFHAWTASPSNTDGCRFVANVAEGLSLVIFQGDAKSETLVTIDPTSLRQGSYVLTDSAVNLSAFTMGLKATADPLIAADGSQTVPYILIDVENN